ALGNHIAGYAVSFVVSDLPLGEKARRYAGLYAQALSPRYWFFENTGELVRHRMKGYGYLRAQMLPFVAIGLLACLRRIRPAPHGVVVVAAAAAPTGAAVAALGATRLLSFVVPAALLTVLGIDVLFAQIRWAAVRNVAAVGLFGVLSLSCFQLLGD